MLRPNCVISYISLGSNQQDPTLQLNLALKALAKIKQIQIMQISSFYQTKPVGFLAQPDFINAVAQITTSLAPEALLSTLLSIEHKMGRIRTLEKNGPRIIDLDLLLYGEVHMHSATLTLPHPRMWERAFVLDPLFEIAPHLQGLSTTYVTY